MLSLDWGCKPWPAVSFALLASVAVELLIELLGADSAAVLEDSQDDTNECVIHACAGWPQEAIGVRMPAPKGSPISKILATGQATVVEDYATEPWFLTKPLLEAAGINSSIGVAIGGDHRAWGILSAMSESTGKFGPADADFVQAIANVLAMVLERDQTNAALSDQALHDPLTELANRSLLVDRIESSLVASRRLHDGDVVVQFIDPRQLQTDQRLAWSRSRRRAALRSGAALAGDGP